MNTNPIEHSEWTDQLSDYLDGGLSPEAFAAIEEHLGACGSCRRVLEELKSVVTEAGRLGPIEPSRDLWAGIAATIRAPMPVGETGRAKVIALPTAGLMATDAPPGEGRITFSRPQLMAASVALIAASSLATWLAGPGLGGGATPTVAEDVSAAAVRMASQEPGAPPALAEEITSLEHTLAAARSVLDPNTVRILERNLAVVQQAIEDSRRALEQDPGNEFLARHLERVYERKLMYLREAVQVTEWAG